MAIRFSLTDPFVIGRYQKAPIYLHPTFFIAAAMLAWPFWSSESLRGPALAGLFIAVIFVSEFCCMNSPTPSSLGVMAWRYCESTSMRSAA